MVGRTAETLHRRDVLRVVRQNRAVNPDGVLIAAEHRELVREIELDVLVDLASTAVRWVVADEGAEGIGVDLFGLGWRVRRLCGLLVVKNVQPLRGVVDGIAAAARHGNETDQDEGASHRQPK